MPNVAVPSIAVVSPTSADKVLGVQGAAVKLFAASPPFAQLAASTGAGLVGYGATEIYAAGTAGAAMAEINNRLYAGTYAADPTTRPDGSAIQAGDEYFNSTSNLTKRYNGATWVASDISTANLAASGGSLLVGHGAETVYAALTHDTVSQAEVPVIFQMFAESGETTHLAKRSETITHAGTHTGTYVSGRAIVMRAPGSGTNGPANADCGLTISAIKQDFASTSVVGEVDGLYIVCRQGGAGSDCSPILIDCAHFGTGFIAAMEAVTNGARSGGAFTQGLNIQLGVVNNLTNTQYGAVSSKSVGNGGIAFFAQNDTSAAWDYFFKGRIAGGLDVISIDGAGKLTMTATSGLTPSKAIRVRAGGVLSIRSDADAEIFALDDTGALSLAQGLTCSTIQCNNGVTSELQVKAYNSTAIPAGGTAGKGFLVSSTANFGMFFGSGAPTLSAAKGSIYLRSDGTTTNDRAYINSDGGTTWTNLTTAA